MIKKYLTEEEIEQYIKKLEEYNSMGNMEIDIHQHTTASDGTQSPLKLLFRAMRSNKKIISMTDHDSVKGYKLLLNEIAKYLEILEELDSNENIKDTDKKRIINSSKNLLKLIEEIKLLMGTEIQTTYKGCNIEILAYGFDIEQMEERLDELKEGLIPRPQILLEGFKRIVEEDKLDIDTYFMENRTDFIKLFFHELQKHPENSIIYSDINTAEEFADKYINNPSSEFYVDMSKERKSSQIEADFLKMIEKNKEKIIFDTGVIKYSYNATGQFFNELKRNPQTSNMLGEEVITLKDFIYKHLYNSNSPFFIDMSRALPSKESVIEAIHNSGGEAFIAHVGRYNNQFDVKQEIKEGTLLEGLDGIEVFYPDHDYEFIRFLLNEAEQRRLDISGGSDDHAKLSEGLQYQMGTVDIKDIRQTNWINHHVTEGKTFLDRSNNLKDLRKRLRYLYEKYKNKENVVNKDENIK